MQVITELHHGKLETITVAWEPCSDFHDDPDAGHGCCAGCGWAPDDHPVEREVELPAAA
jgi:hypothetical protein